jgi:hypothetical protein
MNKSQIVTAFNAHFLEFVDDILRVFPNNAEIKQVRKTISKGLILLPKILIKLFKEHVVEIYRTQIESGDITFFVDNDYKNDVIRLGYSDQAQSILETIDCLRAPVREMEPSNQANVIKYMQNLTKLSDMYKSSSQTTD